ncbi:CoA transferase [uncultured Williamsia sp.]|uniref:CoA transferase n=1 Tax=uncultured Williamsia sp. TaxID=259311 RepID=UPI00262EDE83|nr:CoA transferase [uncultured Williamsia sp.]
MDPTTGDATAQWARHGLTSLCGEPSGTGDASRAGVLVEAHRVLAHVRPGATVGDAAVLLAGRAALSGRSRAGSVSVGGASRLLPARDGHVAITLSRDDDVDLVPAFLRRAVERADSWVALTDAARVMSPAEWVDRGAELGLPVAALGETAPGAPVVSRRGSRRSAGERPLLVADLSSLWAGPLCTRLLADAGATVVKVESPARPDGARQGDVRFFDWMNHGKLSWAVDPTRSPDRVRQLLRCADVVVEASRPRALRRLGLDSSSVPARPGQVWLRITGHGLAHPDRVAFGDDAAVAGGLVVGTPRHTMFCADAVADPLTGLEAARAVTQSLARGGGEVIDVALSTVAARYAALGTVDTGARIDRPDPPSAPPFTPSAARLGADGDRVERLLASIASTGYGHGT